MKDFAFRDHIFMTPFFCLSNWSEFGNTTPAPGRQNLSYQPPHPHPTSIPFGISAAYRLYLVDVSITYHVIATHNSLQLKNNLS